jgi:GTP-binding protein YchF
MKLAIIGLSNSGKTTVFNALTRQRIETTPYPSMTGEPHMGIVKVPDQRVDRLAAMYTPKKFAHATVEYIDFIGIAKGDAEQNRKVFDFIKDADAAVHVVRAFEDDAVSHSFQSVNPLRDIETVEFELVFGDLELVEKRLQRMDEAAKKGKKQSEAEKKLLIKCREALQQGISLRNVHFDNDEQREMRHLQFISTKPEVVVLNIAEGDLHSKSSTDMQSRIEEFFASTGSAEKTSVVTLSGKIEMELAQMPPEEARAFLDDLKIKEPALNRLIRVSYDLLGLISFLTIGDEVRAWTITQGTSAQAAAGKVHSDMERGFIRAEVTHFDDFSASGSIAAAKDRGLVRLEGKQYIVRDGDIINFRFNV